MRGGNVVRLYLLRHGEVRSHRGDVPITSDAIKKAKQVGAGLVDAHEGTLTVLSGETRRATETAEHLCKGIEGAGGSVDGPIVAHALRNPDLYLSGHRVNMVSSHGALASQVPGLDVSDVVELDFFPQFIAEDDRIGWWLRHPDPPGEDAASIAARVRSFARSFTNPYRAVRSTVVTVTHSPLLRAVGLDALGYDIGEPDWVSGLHMEVHSSGAVTTSVFPEKAT